MSNNNEWYQRRSKNKNKAFDGYRSQYMRDEGRVVHSFAFRRLQGKTQILGIEQGDYHRNRLTHSLEVASIARSVAEYLYKKYKDKKKVAIDKDKPGINKDVMKLLECQELVGKEYKKNDKSLKEYHHLITTISLLHDIGHPPFGHAGEEALNFKMHEFGGFEGNAQTLHLVTDLEDYKEKYGLDLTRRTLLGLIKYPNTYEELNGKYPNEPVKNRNMKIGLWKPPKCIYNTSTEIYGWIMEKFDKNDRVIFSEKTDDSTVKNKDENFYNKHMKTLHKSFDCSIMDVSDDISYTAHDLEDAIFMKLITKDDFENKKWMKIREYFQKSYEKRRSWYKDICDKNNHLKKLAFSHMVGLLVKNIKIKDYGNITCPLLKYNAEFKSDTKTIVDEIKKLIAEKTHQTQEVQTIVFGGMITLMQLFDVLYANHKKLLPKQYEKKTIGASEYVVRRVVCDYIASMTDEYARRLHERIYCDLPGSVFHKL